MLSSKLVRHLCTNASHNRARLISNANMIVRGYIPPLPVARTPGLGRASFIRSFSSSHSRMAQPVEPNESDSEPNGSPKSESEKWISILENTTSAPWLFSSIPEAEKKLILAYTLLFQIVLYLSRPEGGEQFLSAFESAPAPPTSEIGRARVAVPIILRATVHHLSTVPLNSPLRVEHSDVFDIFGALQAVHDMYLTENIPDHQTWSAFWSRAQPIVLELGMKLDEKGFGLPKDDTDLEGEKKQSE